MMTAAGTRPDRLAVIAEGLGQHELDAAASAALGLAGAVTCERPRIVPLSAHHYDNRTLGMLHISGQASEPSGRARDWSCVVKVLDLGVPPRAINFVDPEHEVLVYREQLFAADDLPFRPARCYRVSAGIDGTTLLWLEDLTGRRKPPFTIDEVAEIAAHLGAWNGYHALRPPTLPFEAMTNSFLLRWERSPMRRQLPRLYELSDHRYVRAAYRGLSLDVLAEFQSLADRLNHAASALPPSLCFGDCNVGNLFVGVGETIAVDWASVAFDPIGVDMGCMIGSAIAWGRTGADIAENERTLFDRYVDALWAAGWRGDREDVRRAFFGQYSGYLCFAAAIPALLVDEVFPIPLVEQRFSATADEIPGLVAGVITLLPGYTEDLRQLL